ncbi:energy transducer TonB [Luteimonas sp. Y-2-2-4F]|nr:energy transducer TonB [Luteimonas sp. Y-2-2-4F]MCD9031927.1 energy transducer TonB [Luteimonas sp. Y-2-2-4F]
MTTTSHHGQRRPYRRRLLAAGLACLLAACSQEPAAPDDAQAPAGGDAPAAATQDAPASDAVAALSADELRAAASRAYQESRLYAPAGDNAMEYYIALREKQPGDAGASSALTDLLPMTVIATEQARDREDFEEAERLRALIQRADPNHPAVGRLTSSISTAREASQARAQQQQLTAEQEAERRRQLEAERAQQQQAQQAEAARELAAQQEAQRQAEQQAQQTEQAEQAQAGEREAAARRAAEARAAEQRAAEQRAAEEQAAAAAPAAGNALRAISTPAPRYPSEALRSGQSGEVLVEFTVAPDGSVSNARVVRADPPRVFDREALAAVRRWRFEPVDAPITTRRTIGFTSGN